jgi:hypothetical protein
MTPLTQSNQQREIEQAIADTKEFNRTIGNVNQVEDRIKALMNSINITRKMPASIKQK